MLTITSYLSKTFMILLTFVVPFLITVVFLPRAIPKDWKNAISHGNQAHTDEQKYARLMFAEKSFCPPLVESHLREKTFTPSAEYELPFKIPIENKPRSFQFKLIHNSFSTNQRLWKMNVKSSPKCEQCDAPYETISNTFYECPAIKIVWEAIDWWNRKRSENINPNPTEVLYGYKPESNSFHTFNHYLLIARYYVYLARNKFETPKLEVFIVLQQFKSSAKEKLQ